MAERQTKETYEQFLQRETAENASAIRRGLTTIDKAPSVLVDEGSFSNLFGNIGGALRERLRSQWDPFIQGAEDLGKGIVQGLSRPFQPEGYEERQLAKGVTQRGGGVPQATPPVIPGALKEISPPQEGFGGFESLSGGGGGGRGGYTADPFNAPQGPDFGEVRTALGQMTPGEAPTPPTDRDLLNTMLAGAAQGAAQGESVGEILALAGAGGYSAREGQKARYQQDVDKYSERINENARMQAQVLASIDTAQAEFDLKVADMQQEHTLSIAQMGLQHDIAAMNSRLEMLKLTKPEFHAIGGGMGVIMRTDPSGRTTTETVDMGADLRQLEGVVAKAKLITAVAGLKKAEGGGQAKLVYKNGAFESTFPEGHPMYSVYQQAIQLEDEEPGKQIRKLLEEDLPEEMEMLQVTNPEEYENKISAQVIQKLGNMLMSQLGQDNPE
jgi:hypothetical protein